MLGLAVYAHAAYSTVQMQDLVDLLAGRRVDLRAAEGAYWRSFAGRWKQALSLAKGASSRGCRTVAALQQMGCDQRAVQPAVDLCSWQGCAHVMLLAVRRVHAAREMCHITSRCYCATPAEQFPESLLAPGHNIL